MADWTKSMQQTFEYYTVDPGTWKDVKRLNNVISCSISRDSSAETLGSATIDITESVGECYIRVYLIIIQKGLREKHPLGTFLVQTPSTSFNGKIRNVSMDAYTPLLELKEKQPPLGYFVVKDSNVADIAYQLTRENARAPIVPAKNDTTLYSDFVAETDETWATFIAALLAYAKYSFALDELGRILFEPIQDISALQPVWTYNDDNSSILSTDISMEHDIYGIPNVVEVIYSDGEEMYYSRVVNDDENSPTSTVNRGREIIHRDTSPTLTGNSTQKQIDEYAENLLKQLSSVEYTITYSHGYCPVRLGDCVRLNYERAGLTDIKAKVISQTIDCKTGCQVSETAVFTNKLWR